MRNKIGFVIVLCHMCEKEEKRGCDALGSFQLWHGAFGIYTRVRPHIRN